jgi:hypothetical protein
MVALPLSLFPLFFNNSYTEVALSLHFLSEVYLILSFPSFLILQSYGLAGGRFLCCLAWLRCIYPLYGFSAL